METKEAFARLITERGVYKKLNVTPQMVKNWRARLAEGKLSEELMKEQLLAAGWVIARPIMWAEPSKSDN
jgi:transposase-like protein